MSIVTETGKRRIGEYSKGLPTSKRNQYSANVHDDKKQDILKGDKKLNNMKNKNTQTCEGLKQLNKRMDELEELVKQALQPEISVMSVTEILNSYGSDTNGAFKALRQRSKILGYK